MDLDRTDERAKVDNLIGALVSTLIKRIKVPIDEGFVDDEFLMDRFQHYLFVAGGDESNDDDKG